MLTGEGADEWLVGYPWYKIAKVLGYLDILPGLPLGKLARRAYLRLKNVPQYSAALRKRSGGDRSAARTRGSTLTACSRFPSSAFTPRRCAKHANRRKPWADLQMPLERAKRWPRSIAASGSPAASRSPVIFCRERAIASPCTPRSKCGIRSSTKTCSTSPPASQPKWKLHGFRDKHLLRLLAERWLPPSVYNRQKVIFRAPLDSFHLEPEPPYIAQLLSEESLRRTGYFDPAAVRHWRRAYQEMSEGSLPRISVEGGLAAVVATQLWHQTYIDSSLAEVPGARMP